MTTDFSGVGTAEAVLQELKRNAEAVGGCLLPSPCNIMVHRACDADATCRRILRYTDSRADLEVGPLHVLADITERISPHLLHELNSAHGKAVKEWRQTRVLEVKEQEEQTQPAKKSQPAKNQKPLPKAHGQAFMREAIHSIASHLRPPLRVLFGNLEGSSSR